MDPAVAHLASSLLLRLATKPSAERLIVGICGVPASGKSSFARRLLFHLDALLETDDRAILVSQDGWHLSRAQLSTFPDPKLAADRRGAHWTFDARAYLQFIQSLRSPVQLLQDRSEPSQVNIISAPGFDHALKDPSPDFVSIMPHHRIVIIEGLYVFLNIDIWKDAAEMLDERYYLRVDEVRARARLVERHVLTGVAANKPEAEWRADENDLPNGRFVIAHMFTPTEVIDSIDDLSFIA